MIEIEGLTKRFGPISAVAGIDLVGCKGRGPRVPGTERRRQIHHDEDGNGLSRADVGPGARLRTRRRDRHDRGATMHRLSARRRTGLRGYDAAAVPVASSPKFAASRETRSRRGSSAVVDKTELDPVLDQPIDTLSKGFKRRVGLAQAILHDPPVLIMDEPTDGLDPNQKHAVRALLRAMAPDKAIIISTHLLEEVEAICTRAVIIDRGRVVADGTPAELLARSRHHNAVTLALPAGAGRGRQGQAQGAHGVASRRQTLQQKNGLIELTAFPKGGALLIENISALAVAEKWDVKELYAEAGRLDDVFRAITTHDADARTREPAT